MSDIKNKLNLGFTLIELLIVITLLGVLAVAVLAAINPIEQANRARDAKYKADASQLIAAIDRYFVSKEEFPWMTGTALTVDTAVNFITAASSTIGVCGDATCSIDGVLITAQELKTEFTNRDFIAKTSPTFADLMYVGKATGSSSSVYACYVPKSKSERSKATKTLTTSSPTLGTATDCATRTYVGLGTSCVTCLPQ